VLEDWLIMKGGGVFPISAPISVQGLKKFYDDILDEVPPIHQFFLPLDGPSPWPIEAPSTSGIAHQYFIRLPDGDKSINENEQLNLFLQNLVMRLGHFYAS